MSCSERFVRHHKQQTDRAIHHAYWRLASDAPTVTTFHELLNAVRHRAPRLLDASTSNEHHPGIEALVNLSRFHRAHIRLPTEWPVSQLAQHLVCKYQVPAFLASSWYSPDDPAADTKRAWFIAHARGVSFRSLNLPIALTRKMEHNFTSSPLRVFQFALILDREARLVKPAPSQASNRHPSFATPFKLRA